MSGESEKVRGLKDYAATTLFGDWHVTPELRAQLRRRIRLSAKRAPSRRLPRFMVWAPAVLLSATFLVYLGSGVPAGPDTTYPEAGRESTPQVAPFQAQDQYGRSRPDAGSPPPAISTYGAPQVLTVKAYDSVVVGSANSTLTSAVTDSGRAAAKGVLTDANGNTVPGTNTPVQGAEVEPGRKVIMNADYALKVKDAPAVAAELQQLTTAAGGYVVESTLSQSDDGAYAGRLVLRVPAPQYGQAILDIRRLGEIKGERQWSQDVTSQFMDLQVRLGLQQEMEQKLADLALKAASFDDWLKLTNQINETRRQIESLQGSLKQMANQVDYATITVALNQPGAAIAAAPAPGLSHLMSSSFTNSLRALGNIGKAGLLGLAAAVPFLISLAILLLPVLLWLRRRRKAD